MNIETIDAAILAHVTWVARFQSAIKGISTETFDIGAAADDTACVLGQWLQTECAHTLLEKDLYNKINVIHGAFHQVAGNIAARLNQREAGNEIEEWLAEFNNLSKQLVTILLHGKKNM